MVTYYIGTDVNYDNTEPAVRKQVSVVAGYRTKTLIRCNLNLCSGSA